VKALPVKLRRDSLSAPSDQARFLEAKAGNRTQSDGCYELTLVLTGGSDDETDSKKATYLVAGRNNKTLTKPEISIPPHLRLISGTSMGFWRLK
jgi:hypothetical protein